LLSSIYLNTSHVFYTSIKNYPKARRKILKTKGL
jgi:hypothetical protein